MQPVKATARLPLMESAMLQGPVLIGSGPDPGRNVAPHMANRHGIITADQGLDRNGTRSLKLIHDVQHASIDLPSPHIRPLHQPW